MLGELDDREQQRVEQHLATGCESCKQSLLEILEGVDLLFEIGPTAELRGDRAAAILARARVLHAEQAIDRNAGFVWRREWPTLAVSLMALAAGWLLAATIWPLLKYSQEPSHSSGQTAGSTKLGDQRPVSVPTSRIGLGYFQDLAGHLNRPDAPYQTTLVASRTVLRARSIQGLVICDTLARELHFYGRSFPPSPAGSDYVLWIGGASIAQPVETLKIAVDGSCKAVVPLPRSKYERVFITLEPSGTLPPEPTGTTQLSF